MGALCSKNSDSQVDANGDRAANGGEGGAEGSMAVMFRRFDKENKGYISLRNLQDMMKDDKTYFQGRDVNHIIEKFGTDGKMTLPEFKSWWTSTYTTYNDDNNLQALVEEVTSEQNKLESISETPELPPRDSKRKTSVAISRS